ncbi:MAG: hypothetical protein A3B38_01040 [Candidatus Levybacteria bacterium RIFCSPLOWO2_01_FULL_36_13]|nr:MAG: hypothetical protein A2684_02280 [Candidatus Levybacteria bacterium RIFCSPHIGHO2_01_FULL_36_15b]OGH35472.1 MAG: hypothetical protein A3B38_01040 [Candidatus Levybacteria bacterium RIFCSPLOWO2_01_FULL_36_13]
MEGRLGRLINKIRPQGEPISREKEYERRLSGFRGRMEKAREDLSAGKALVLQPDGTSVQASTDYASDWAWKDALSHQSTRTALDLGIQEAAEGKTTLWEDIKRTLGR